MVIFAVKKVTNGYMKLPIEILTIMTYLVPVFIVLLAISFSGIIIGGIIDVRKKRFYWAKWSLVLLGISVAYLVIEVLLD